MKRLLPLVCIAGISLSACATADEEEAYMSDQPEAARSESGGDLEQQRQALAGEIKNQLSLSASNIEHCALLAYGHKPCGGPEQYLPYSTENMTEEEHKELLLKVENFNALDRRIKEEQGIVSDCALVPEPQLVLQEGQCAVTSERPGFDIY